VEAVPVSALAGLPLAALADLGVAGYGLRWPWLLVALAAVWALFVLWPFAAVQRRAIAWAKVHAAPRFGAAVTRYDGVRLRLHLALLVVLGALLAVAAAGPVAQGVADTVGGGGRVLLLLDASVSMRATDVATLDPGLPPAADRFEQARQIAVELVDRLPGHRFAVAGFSGVASFELPMSDDRQLVLDALATSEIHTFYRDSGSSFTAALDAALHHLDEGTDATDPLRAGDLQVVLLSDGEQPREEDYEAPLAALAERGVAVHAIALGSAAGESRVVYDFRDVVAGREERRTLAEFVTRREERHLRRIAGATGGSFRLGEGETVAPLAAALAGHRGGRQVADPRARRDLSLWPLAAFLVLFLAEAASFGRRRRPSAGFDVSRLGDAGRATLVAVAALSLLATSCGETPLERAHVENELGIAADEVLQHEQARRHYRRAIGFGLRGEIPTYNLARSRTLAGDWSAAHDLYQRALALDPGLTEAVYNDGYALFAWGLAERDPRGCQLERTRQLWEASLRRFEAAEKTWTESEHPMLAAASANREKLAGYLFETSRLIAQPPPECKARVDSSKLYEGGARDRGTGGRRNVGRGEGASGAAGGDANPDPEGEEPESHAEDARGGQPLDDGEREEIRQALERIERQRGEEGKFLRRSRAEQFPRESWENPDDVIWW
jgi:tetratricopeptide (TPR) repeat protein